MNQYKELNVYDLTIDDSLFGVSCTAKTLTVNIRDCICIALPRPAESECHCEDLKFSMEQKKDLTARLIERMLKVERFKNEEVFVLEPV